LKLVFHFENDEVEEFSVKKNKVLVGRGSDCDVILSTPGFSRHHALLELVGGEFFVTDLNSTNGVFIDSNRITPSQPVPLKTFANGSCNTSRVY
jgi:pSer/pThr/pTyr-binding forkhead associated (FHA) protein